MPSTEFTALHRSLRWAAWFTALTLVPGVSKAHDLGLSLRELRFNASAIGQTLELYGQRSPLPRSPRTPAEQRRALGVAEVEHALGNEKRAMEILIGRIEDPKFRAMPEYVDGLLLGAEVLEQRGELAGALMWSYRALQSAQKPAHVAEAGARWFRMARMTQRTSELTSVYALWVQKGGPQGTGPESSALIQYEVGLALRQMGSARDALELLAKIPSTSRFGSRAAFVSAVLLLEQGQLGAAETWFSAIMDWAVPEAFGAKQRAVEVEVRALAALSAARLMYERGALAEAEAAYAQVPERSKHRKEACWELAYLASERDRQRDALRNLACVKAHGASTQRRLDVAIMESSLLAHLDRYADSLEAYRSLHESVIEERNLVAASFARVERPAEFLFSGMERTAADASFRANPRSEPVAPTPGPASLLEGAWTTEVDQAYRVDRGAKAVLDSIEILQSEMVKLQELVQRRDAFQPLRLRQENLRRLIKEIDHLSGHLGKVQASASKGQHASAHREDTASVRQLEQAMRQYKAEAKRQLAELAAEERHRTEQAMRVMRALEAELTELKLIARRVVGEARGPSDGAAEQALQQVLDRLEDVAMRAEVGVLDTFWLKKQERTEKLEGLVLELESTEASMDEMLSEQ